MTSNYVIIALFIIIIGLVVWYMLKPYSSPLIIKRAMREVEKPPSETYLKPAEFKPGVMPITKDYHTANLCDPSILYPINQPGVYYGAVTPKNCPMARFVEAP